MIEHTYTDIQLKSRRCDMTIEQLIENIQCVKSIQRGTIDQEFGNYNSDEEPYDWGYQDYKISPVNFEKSVLIVKGINPIFGTPSEGSDNYNTFTDPHSEFVDNSTIRIYMTGTGKYSSRWYKQIKCQWQVIEFY